jgi:hydroxyacylglutathione hydrolase
MAKILPLKALNDNYIWVILNDQSQALIFDPGEAHPVIRFFQENQHITLSGVLITHKHYDHCQGVPEIIRNFPVPVFGPKHAALDFVDFPQKEKNKIKVEGFNELHVMEIPGHTLEHIAYYNSNSIFCGDTLFTGGCGRIFEGTSKQMLESLQKICALPNETLIYCGHEYTLANLEFAFTVEPHNPELLNRIHACKKLRKNHQPTVPAKLELEKQTNPFLRCEVPDVIQSVEKYYQRDFSETVEVFEYLRKWKDGFVPK